MRNFSLSLLLAGIIGLAAAQPSSVHELGLDSIFDRATSTGKYVGATCQTSAECYSKNCALVSSSTTVKQCQRQPAGGPCFENGNCLSRNCRASAGICITPSKTNGTCSSSKGCVSGLSCESGKCKAKAGSSCTNTGDCVYGSSCRNGVCGLALGPNRACNDASDCISNSCSIDNDCATDDGEPTPCEAISEYASNGVCGRYNVGHTCVYPGDCFSGICHSGVCAANSTVGDFCVRPYQCTNGLTCADNACAFFANNTRYPLDACSTNAQCKTKECGYNWELWAGQGPWYFSAGNAVPNPVCRPFFDGEKGCRTDIDCIGRCQSGACKLQPNGAKCIYNQQCQGLNMCSLDSGVCYTPKTTSGQAAGQPCRSETANQCASGVCGIDKITRPSLTNNGNVSVYDTICR